MSEYWTPSGTAFVITSSPQDVVSVSNQIEGLARIVNTGTTAGFAGFVSVSGTIGEAELVPIAAKAVLYIAFAKPVNFIIGTVSESAVFINPGYALK